MTPGAICALLRLHVAASVLALLLGVAQRHHVPGRVLLAVCAVESGLGTRGNILCGCAPQDARRRGYPAQAECAARSLAHGYAHCGTWPNALRRYRYGLAHHGCPRRDPERYAPRVMRVAGRLGGAR